jgi:hypothetical protein
MNPVRLARIAAEAEGVRLRGLMTRLASRVIMGVIAFLFVLGAVVFAHIAAWLEIRADLDLTPLATAGILGGIDLLVAVILGLLASRSSPSRVEVDALDVRRRALQGISSTLSVGQMLIPVLRLITNVRRRRRYR